MARHPTTTVVRIAASGDPELSCGAGPEAARSTPRAIVVLVAGRVARLDRRVDAGAVDVVGASVTGALVVTVGAGWSVAVDTGGAAVVGAAVVGATVGGDVGGAVGGVVVDGGGGNAVAGEMPGCASLPNANASMLPTGGR